MDNSEQQQYWNSGAGTAWVETQSQLDRMLAPLSDAAVARADVQPGERVIDIGCGCGATTLALAQRGATVWGVDISAPMLELARQRAADNQQVVFSEADAATQAYTADHQLVFSRFGVMFFADAQAAFANIRTALSADGRLVFICWQAPRANPWMSVVGAAVQPLLPEVGAPPDPRAPGPFAFADQDWLAQMLVSAGFSNVQIESVERQLTLAQTVDEAIAFQTKVGPLARGLAELDDARRGQALQVAADALQPYVTPTGIHMGSACWLVQANR